MIMQSAQVNKWYIYTNPSRNRRQCQNRTGEKYWFSQNLGLATFMFCVHPTDICSTYQCISLPYGDCSQRYSGTGRQVERGSLQAHWQRSPVVRLW